MSAIWNALLSLGVPKKTGDDLKDQLDKSKVDASIGAYNNFFNFGSDKEKMEERKKHAQEMVNHFYNLVTDFYEYGWGQSFHFAPRFKGESFNESIVRHEYYLAYKAGLRPGQHALDVGCGVGGPQRNIVRFSGAKVTGITINAYQVERATRLNKQAGIAHLTEVVQGDFMDLPFPEQHFDSAYAIEATCHSPDRVACFKQVFKTLKPGGLFAVYEWGMTDKYDEKNLEHRRIKHGIEEGNGLPTLVVLPEIIQSVKNAGFEVLEQSDLAEDLKRNGFEVAWHEPLKGGYKSLQNVRMSRAGRFITHTLVNVLETVKIAPKGTVATSNMLNKTADALVEGGDTGIFTPMFFFLARKPSNS